MSIMFIKRIDPKNVLISIDAKFKIHPQYIMPTGSKHVVSPRKAYCLTNQNREMNPERTPRNPVR